MIGLQHSPGGVVRPLFGLPRIAGQAEAAALAYLPPAERSDALDSVDDGSIERLLFDWRFWGRPDQLAPAGAWRFWLLLAGRGFGKTRTGAEWVRMLAENGMASRIALVAPTAGDARDVMVEGESGIMAICPPWCRPVYESTKRRVTWPNGVIATTYSADEPDRLRGPQHDAAWCDEMAAWRYPDTWDMLLFGLRLGNNPRAVITTTPKPVRLVRELIARQKTGECVITRGSTRANAANLARDFLSDIIRRYEGTRLGRQELEAELLEDVSGALWSRADIEATRVKDLPGLVRIVVAIDPAATSGEESDETGIIVAGLGLDGHGYVLEDISGRYAPTEWARLAVSAYKRWEADRIVAEINNGGEMVEATIRMVDPNVPYGALRATRGKAIRAEPVSALYEQHRVHHLGLLAALEDQMCGFMPDAPREKGRSPDRMDALVWALYELIVGGGAGWSFGAV